MKNRIWKNWKTFGISLAVTGILVTGNAAWGAEAGDCAQEITAQIEIEQSQENLKEDFRAETEDVLKSDMTGTEIFMEEEETTGVSEGSVTEQTSESVETPVLTEMPEPSEDATVTDTPDFSDQEEKEIKPGYRMWITPEQEQIKAGREMFYTVRLENTGNCRLRNIQLNASFSKSDLRGAWEEKEGAQIQEETLKFDLWESGTKKEFYFSVQIPEDQSDKIELHLKGNAEYEEKETGELRSLASEEKAETEILPLKADFQVTKTADRTMAVPGDKVVFQICIRNTGERTLHSVITTEKFQMENIPVRFLEAEGIVLNKSRTKAKIEKIEPGNSVGLLAEVTLPEKIKDQKLVNEVIVTSLETGERKVTSKAEIQVYETAETPTAASEDFSDEGAAQNTESQSKAASTHPKTGDPTKPVLWLLMIPGALMAAGRACSRLRQI